MSAYDGRIERVFAIAASAVIAVTLGAAPLANAPGTISVNGAPGPFWVSLFAAVDDSGRLRPEVLSNAARSGIEWRLKEARRQSVGAESAPSAVGPCPWTTIVSHRTASHAALDSWDALKENARAIYRGRIAGIVPGFEGSAPGSLLRLDQIKRVRAENAFPADDPLYVTYLKADFIVEGVRFCNAGPDPAFAPMVGDQVLLFAIDPPVDADQRYLPIVETQLVFERDGRVIWPMGVQRDPSLEKSLDELAAEAKRVKPVRGRYRE